MEPSSTFERLFFTTVRLSSKDSYNKESVGTGFFINQRLKNDSSLIFLCTAKHNIKDSLECVIFMHSEKDEKLQIGNPMRVELDKYKDKWILNERFDVALLSVGGIINQLRGEDKPPYFTTIELDTIPTSDEIKNFIDAVEDIFFVGYPDDKYDKVNMIPIMRKGITATPFAVNFSGEPKFLIDSAIFEGSSGSPLVICNPDSYSIKNIGLHKGNRNIFLGLVSQAYRRMEDDVYINLGICCKSMIIKEMVEKFIIENNFELANRIPMCITR